ncbi:type IV secretory system conjugative DNA transfer family protein [Mumia sp. Pv 4-285]|uniref:type IV secretory system conjugative DNA transfer family protein n=1 Tax=Mumia qirimensis TaxID=3234852 RepID=UPI00351CF3AC
MTSPAKEQPVTDVFATAVITIGAAMIAGTVVLWGAAVLASGVTGAGWHTGDVGQALDFAGAVLSGDRPNDAWIATSGRATWGGGAAAYWSAAVLLIGLGGGLAWIVWRTLHGRTLTRRKRRSDAQWASRRDERGMAVRSDPATRPYRLVAGRSKATRRCLAADDCVSAVVFGPNGAGKTVGLIIPNVLEWAGTVVMTTAKPQDLTPVIGRRSALGPVWVVAPGGAPGTMTARWSPVAYAADPEAADRMADWLVESSGMTGDPKARPWNAQARKYLKGLLLAANVDDRGIDGFIEWAYEGELARERVEQILHEHRFTNVAREYASTWQIHEEGRGSVLFTAFGLADTYNRPTVRAAAACSDFTAAELFDEDRPGTLLLVTPQSETERYTPYFTALISSIVHEAEVRAAERGGPIEPRVLLALDEAGNVFRYPRLPHLLTTGRGNGIQLLLAYHDIAQIEHLYGGREVARTVLSNAKLRILLAGVGDIETLRYFSDLLGQTRVRLGGEQTGPDGKRSRSHSEQRESLAPLHLLQQLPDGEAVVLYQNLPPARVKLRRWYADKALRQLANTQEEART